jgi:uncharacterized lipoprotein YajG
LKITTSVVSIFALGTALLAGCATDPNAPKSASASASASGEEKELVTGSNIPRKDKSALGTKTMSKEELSQVHGNGGNGTGSPAGK